MIPQPKNYPEQNQRFETFQQAYDYASTMVRNGLPTQASRCYSDLFVKPTHNKIFQLLGVSKRSANLCRKLAPKGTWGLEIEPPHTLHFTPGIFGHQAHKTSYYRFAAWYSHYLPYAYGMLNAEWEFKYEGIDYTSINSYFGTVMGFVQLGSGDSDTEKWWRIDPEDTKLYRKIVSAGCCVRQPNLPFDEAFLPAAVFVAMFRADLVMKQFEKDHWIYSYIRNVLEVLKEPIPKEFE